MALQLMKIQASASSTISVAPSATKFFNVTSAETAAGATLSIDAADFFDDTGAAATALPALGASNSYVNVFINGVLQMSGIYTYTAGATGVGSLAIDVPAGGDPIIQDSSIVLEVINYVPTASTTVTT
ncbi:DUF4183 domain-containing protein [Bacillus sp. KH172YL63]|uniref:DUF4183 domain-containing protein n=1 Tax=Bacillus sp. KH172YL63 TaxID=2709784 RepID=UPI0013E51F4A|nr:DUF4183 domain-containing protein [Bacillus sp. KH172YL63]BCB02555.1 hypothetical protein KH172YL63_06880 [Bacillus sp. KH172YL63]